MASGNYEKEFEFKNPRYRSSILTNGVNNAGERALLYATGMDEEALKKPFVGVITSLPDMSSRASWKRAVCRASLRRSASAMACARAMTACAILFRAGTSLRIRLKWSLRHTILMPWSFLRAVTRSFPAC